MIELLVKSIISGSGISFQDAEQIAVSSDNDADEVFAAAFKIKKHFSNGTVDLCAIINAKSGACQEDCSYCAQSGRSTADIPVYPLLSEDKILEKAKEIRDKGVKRFCIVTSGRRVSERELQNIGKTVEKIRKIGLLPCATLGLLDIDALKLLRDSGLERYHHNLETSERFFPEICSTHTYSDKLRTIEAAKEAGLSLCSGGIFGLGETWVDRLDMAFLLRDIEADSVPVNYLAPIQGTPLGDMPVLSPLEALKIISVYRFILPDKEIRVCGGRLQALGDLNPFIFPAGANGLLVGNYLTTLGRDIDDDVNLIRMLGMEIS